MNRSLKYSLLGIAVLALGLVAGLYCYISYYIPQNEAKLAMISVDNSKPAIQAMYNGKYDDAISSFRTLIPQAPNRSDQARLQENLMAALFDRGEGNDFAEAASLAAGIVNDYSVPAWVRALTYDTIARVVYAHDISFYKKYLNKPPFNAYLGTSGTDSERLGAAYLKIFQVSDDIYPTSLAEYGVAGYYFILLIDNSSSQQTPQELATLMRKYVVEGDTRNDAKLYPPYLVVLNQLIRARVIALSNKILKNHPPEESEQAYMHVKVVADSLQKTGIDITNPKIQAVMFTWRFTYADFLLTIFGDVRSADIRTLLAPFGTLTSPDVIGFLERGGLGDIKNLPTTSITWQKASKLAAISPEFKAFLTRMGFRFNI